MFKRLNQLVIPTQIPHAKRHPAELLVKFIILSGLATLSNVTLFKALNLDLASTISVFAAVAMFSCLLALRFFGMLFATYLLVSIVCLSISASALASGGIQSSFIFWMTVAPLGTSMILGKEHGKVVAGLCTIMFSAVLALSLIYLPDPHIPSYIKSSLSAGVAIGVSILSLIFTSNFQSMKDQAFEALDERNQAIERIINNVSSGFLIIDRQLRILPGYSKSCHALLKQETLEGQCLASLLERDERRKVHLQLIWEQVFDDYMPEEVTLGQSPQRFQISDRHYLALDGKAVREANNQIVGILFTINDVTKLIEAERRNDMNQQLLQILRNREAFSDMIRESREFLDELQKHLGKQSAMSMRILHTMKGNTASFGLTAIAGVIHDIESQDVLKLEDLKAIRLGFDDYLKDNHEIIGISSLESVSDVRYSITASKVMDLKRLFENASSHQEALKESGLKWLEEVQTFDIRQYLKPMEGQLQRISLSMGKPARLLIQGDEVRIGKHASRFMQHLPNIFRNSLYHGIEAQEDRGSKPWPPTIEIRVSDLGEFVRLEIKDDGAGIDPEKIRKKVLEKQLLDENSLRTLSDSEVIQFIFADGLSTSETVNEIAGRGAGTAAVKADVEAMGGRILMESQPGQGSCLKVDLPRIIREETIKHAA